MGCNVCERIKETRWWQHFIWKSIPSGGKSKSVNPILIRLRALGLVTVVVLGLAACVAGPRVVGPLHSPISPARVKVFTFPFLPQHYTVVARLDAAWYGGCNSPGLNRRVLAKFRKQAAHLGANGILIVPNQNRGYPYVPHTTFAGPCFLPSAKLAEAIYVKP